MTIFCDTNIISELARPRPNPGVIAWIQNIESISISVITLVGIETNESEALVWFDLMYKI